MANAQFRSEEEAFDREYQRTAWQTALLMNATGNYKKQIKPDSLYKSPYDDNKQSNGKTKDKNYVNNEQETLKQLFDI